MRSVHHKHGHHHTMVMSYPVAFHEKLYSLVLRPLLIIALAAFAITFYPIVHPSGEIVSLQTLLLAALITCARLTIAYVLAVLVAIPLSLFVTSSPRIESIFLPIFDVLESVPILVLFPIFIMLFVRTGYLNGAAISILFITMLWSMVFTIVGGIKIIPKEIIYAGRMFGLSGWSLIRHVILPGAVPQFVTGSILSLAAGWNIIIVAEVLHTYIPGGSSAQDLFGIGSILVNASANAQNGVFLEAVIIMIVIIALFNFFVWQKLLRFAQRFRFD